MPGDRRRLWMGPCRALWAMRAAALAEAPREPSSLWIVPSAAAREPLLRDLAIGRGPVCGLRVWTWEDLWTAVARQGPQPPARLGPAGVRAAVNEAVGRALRAGQLEAVRPIAEAPGFRRLLSQHFAAWAREERAPGGKPPGESAAEREEWRLYGHYRAVLEQAEAVDPEGFAAWASVAWRRSPEQVLLALGFVTVLEPAALSRAEERGLELLRDHADRLLITLLWDEETSLADVYAPAARLHDRLARKWKLAVTKFEAGPERPAGLCALDRELFRADAHERALLDQAQGLAIRGAPQGEGVGLELAHRVRTRVEAGSALEDILIVVPHWDEDAAVACDVLEQCGWPVWADRRRPLASAPAVAALLLAMRVPAHGWECADLIPLLRNQWIRPAWPELSPPQTLAATAAALRDARVFRGRDALADALGRLADSGDAERPGSDVRLEQTRALRARMARPVFERLVKAFAVVEGWATWTGQVERLHRLAGELGIAGNDSGSDSGPANAAGLDLLLSALAEHGLMLEHAGRGDEAWTWPEFAHEVGRMVRELRVPPPADSSGKVRVAAIAAAEGRLARHVLLANLVEGSLPAADVVALDAADSAGAATARLACGREMLRFLRVAGQAGESLDLIYPTTDEKGQTLLPAGFLREVQERLGPGAAEAISQAIPQFQPALLPAELARAPRDARVRAVALALLRNEGDELRRVAARPEHRGPLQSTAAALRVAQWRFGRLNRFGRYDGQLTAPAIRARLARMFEEFTPSQLESLAFCPYQFLAKYVLRLEPVEERDELEDDYSWLGSVLHLVLERLHSTLLATPINPERDGPDAFWTRLQGTITSTIAEEPPPASEAERQRFAIDSARLMRTGERYAAQHDRYVKQEGRPVECRKVEVGFGHDAAGSGPGLVLGQGDQAVHLRGRIDRIDLIGTPEDGQLRVIDYKSRGVPAASDVKSGLALQLPIYALAAFRLSLVPTGSRPADFGYWGLRKEGYKSVPIKHQERFFEGLEQFVVAMVEQLRHGGLPVAPRKDDCASKCDFRQVCRIGQVRAAGKDWAGRPKLEHDG